MRPRLEILEDRLAPANITWNPPSPGNLYFAVPGNWVGGVIPGSSDTVVLNGSTSNRSLEIISNQTVVKFLYLNSYTGTVHVNDSYTLTLTGNGGFSGPVMVNDTGVLNSQGSTSFYAAIDHDPGSGPGTVAATNGGEIQLQGGCTTLGVVLQAGVNSGNTGNIHVYSFSSAVTVRDGCPWYVNECSTLNLWEAATFSGGTGDGIWTAGVVRTQDAVSVTFNDMPLVIDGSSASLYLYPSSTAYFNGVSSFSTNFAVRLVNGAIGLDDAATLRTSSDGVDAAVGTSFSTGANSALDMTTSGTLTEYGTLEVGVAGSTTFSVTGAVNFTSGGVLVAGIDGGGGYDILSVTGNVYLGGTSTLDFTTAGEPEQDQTAYIIAVESGYDIVGGDFHSFEWHGTSWSGHAVTGTPDTYRLTY